MRNAKVRDTTSMLLGVGAKPKTRMSADFESTAYRQFRSDNK